MEKKVLLLFADYYDATTSTRRVINALKEKFENYQFVYWARLGFERESTEPLFENIPKTAYLKTAPPRSIAVLFQFIRFQFWLLQQIKRAKPDMIIAFTFYTIFPALLYRLFLSRRSRVIYDPRDYVAVSYRVNKIVGWGVNLIDNLFMKLADFVIFPDKQFFSHYGKFRLRQNKFFILPNSAEDAYSDIEQINIFDLYNIPRNKLLIPIIGYFSETRGRKVLFEAIEDSDLGFAHFVFAGDLRNEYEISFLSGKSNLTFLPKIPYLHALKIMKESFIVPQMYDPQLLNNVYAFPTKYYDCLMVKTPMVVSFGQKDVYKEIKENNFGFGVEYDNYQMFKNILLKYRETPQLVNKENMRQFFLENYDYSRFKNPLSQVYYDIAGSSKR